MKVKTCIVNFLIEKDIDTVFELQGGMITSIIDEIAKSSSIKIVSVHHEQAAAFAADAYARVTKKPGVAFATSGPGATNLITGIGSCYYDSVPSLFFTGQVNLSEQKGNSLTRQIGFQETDIVEMVKAITKASYSIKTSANFRSLLEEAYNIATTGRPGPVLIDIPMDIQNQEIAENNSTILKNEKQSNYELEMLPSFLNSFLNDLKVSKRPLILAGRGVRLSDTIKFRRFYKKFQLPVVTSLLGFDVIPYDDQFRVGFIGTYGNRWANYALGICDLLVVLGSRLDIRQTGVDVESFSTNKKIYHVDIDPAELNNRIKGCFTINLSINKFLEYALEQKKIEINFKNWQTEIYNKYLEKKDIEELNDIKGINPNIFMQFLSHFSRKAKVITTDVGNNQMWTSQSYQLSKNQLFITSGGMGAMGFALPASIGACFATSKSPVLAISGDGGMQINIQELQTVVRNKLPVKIVILNNKCLGMIRQFQDSYFESCYQSTVNGYSTPDFEKIAYAYGVGTFTVRSSKDITKGLELLWENPKVPFLLNIMIDIHTNVYPKMLFGSPITKMEP